MNTAAPPAADHPAPRRKRVSVTWLILGLAASPLAWIVQLLLTYGLSSNVCSSLQGRGGAAILASGSSETLVLLALNLAALAFCISGGVASALHWRRTQDEASGDVHRALSAGEGRTRFIALCGMLAAIAFGVGILFNTVEPLMISHCWTTRP